MKDLVFDPPPGDGFRHLTACRCVERARLRSPYDDRHDPAMTTPSSKPHLDATTKALIEQLQQDGRRSFAEIGRAVGLSESTVRRRVEQLAEAGIMQIVAVTDPLQVGFPRQAMIGVTTDGDTRLVTAALAAIDEVGYVVSTAGGFDVLIEVVCEDDEHLLDLLNSRIRAIPGVRSTETFVYLKLHKQKYDWGTR